MKKWLLITGIVLVFVAGGVAGVVFLLREEKTEITTETISARGGEGRIVEGESQGDGNTQLKTDSELVFESPEITTDKPQSNAAVLQWEQTKGEGEVGLEFRTNNGERWSEWVHANDPTTEKPDHAKVTHKAMILADEVHKIQYRFEIAGKDGRVSPEVDVTNAELELIDTTKGPSPTKKKPLEAILGWIGLGQKVTARADGPRIYSRAEWGSPEPNSSDRWEPEYREVNRVIVHHTATTMTSDPAAMIRAIWHFHANSNDWGDIGYNYLVDGNGNIYQGRYFNPTSAEISRKEVVGGHTYGWNYGTSGIAALGDFTGSNEAPEVMLQAIGTIAAFKIHKSGVNPAGYFDAWPALMGHRDALQTACPANVHKHLPSIRIFAAREYAHYYQVDHQDYAYVAQGKNNQQMNELTMQAGKTAHLFFDIRNAGVDTWRKDGQFPVRLGTKNPFDRRSPFATGSWLNPGRPGSFSHRVTGYNADGSADLQTVDEITPGQVARFTIPVKAPEAGGTYTEFFQPVVENYSWFIRDFAMNFKIHVTARSFAWHGVEQRVYTDNSKTTLASSSTTMNNLRGGQRYYVVAKVKNDGNQTWRNDGAHPVKLGTFRAADRPSAVCNPALWNSPHCNRAATLEESTVTPGQTGTFEFWIDLPYHTTDRQFREYFNIVAEGLAWAPDRGMYWQFNVAGENLNAHATSIQGYEDDSRDTVKNLGQLSPNERFYVEMRIRNDGNVTWQPSGARQVRLGTVNTNDRKSNFCDATWLSPTMCNRIADSVESSVTPGQTGTYRFWMKAPAAPGTYTEHVNLVAEGFSWFRNQSIPIVMTVQP